MKKKVHDRLLAGVLVATALLSATSSYAFDDERKGFIVGFGLGSGMLQQSSSLQFSAAPPTLVPRSLSGDNSYVAITTTFKVGYAPSNRLAIYYVQDIAWNRDKRTFGGADEITWGMVGLGGVGVTYYLSPQARSFYVLAAYGFSTWTAPFEEQTVLTKTWYGSGAAAGFGWEFAQHLSVEVTGMWGNPAKSGEGWNGNIDTFSLLVLFNAMAY